MNAPDRSESWLLDVESGEKKLEYAKDTKIPNCGTFKLNKEDHTAANLLRMQLLRLDSVYFAGYRMPHPLENLVELRIQTTSAETTPLYAMDQCLEDLITETTSIRNQLQTTMHAEQHAGHGHGLL